MPSLHHSLALHERQTDGQIDRPDRQLCIALRAPRERRTDGQTAHSASLCGYHLRDRWTDGPLRVRAAGWTDSRSLSSVLPAAHHLPTGSILWKMLPRGAELGSHPPACVGPPGTASVGALTGWSCWHLLAPRLTHSASTGLIPCSTHVQLMREANVVEFISTDGRQFSSHHLSDTARRTSLQSLGL